MVSQEGNPVDKHIHPPVLGKRLSCKNGAGHSPFFACVDILCSPTLNLVVRSGSMSDNDLEDLHGLSVES